MRLNFKNERLLAVVAHPDDMELLCAGTLARAKADGAEIAVCVLCRGDKGQPNPPLDDLAETRRRETQAAADLLGARLLEGGFGDGELFDDVASRRIVVELFREFSPSLVLAHSPCDYHPDHRAAGRLAEVASWFGASPGQITESPAIEKAPELWWMDTVDMIDFIPGFYVDVSQYIDLKRDLIRCHESQLRRGADPGFSPLEELMLRQSAARGAQAGVAAAEAFHSHSAWKRIGAW